MLTRIAGRNLIKLIKDNVYIGYKNLEHALSCYANAAMYTNRTLPKIINKIKGNEMTIMK